MNGRGDGVGEGCGWIVWETVVSGSRSMQVSWSLGGSLGLSPMGIPQDDL